MPLSLAAQVEALAPRLIAWRRDFHRHPEQGWTEFRTASRVAESLDAIGYQVAVGDAVVDREARLGVPDAATLADALARARDQGGVARWLAAMEGGLTGVVGTLDTGRPGPTLAYRFDLDALPILESEADTHRPARLGFRSCHPGSMHACAHDGHTALGLGLAHLLPALASRLTGRIKLLFQPAEEGVRGAGAMAEAGVVDDVDHFIATHLGLGQPEGTLICGADGFLATTKLDVTFTGRAAHAGGEPEKGRNALLAAAQAVQALHAIAPHAAGASRLNVGRLEAGSGRNVIADTAFMQLETRGSTTAINDYVEGRAREVLAGAARMQGVELAIARLGAAVECASSPALVERIATALEGRAGIRELITHDTTPAGSEDATLLMRRVIERGGEAAYLIFGTRLAAGHHHPEFDFDEATLAPTLEALASIALALAGEAADADGRELAE
ncbi:amidohydrolase [Salinicola endophyticus]|uniref:amidohydrolase n=1 Tax=Salinicola endophyticus TaxID=1949083 RepID=UPI000DA16568|nr:amidohydrolase [Salinicola endophyticus]